MENGSCQTKIASKSNFLNSLEKSKERLTRLIQVIYYLHGGAYIVGTAAMYRNLTSLLAKECGCPIFALNYRLAPEYPFPAGLHDALAGYLWLINPTHPMFKKELSNTHEAFSPEDVIISGDSAGGGLTMALLNYINMYLRTESGELSIPLPRGAVLLSPWVDLSCSSKSWEDNKGLDFLPAQATDLHKPVAKNVQHPVYSYCFGENGRELNILSPVGSYNRIPSVGVALNGLSLLPIEANCEESENRKKDREWLKQMFDDTERDALERFVRHPLVSPVFGDLTGLPPILIVIKTN